MATAARVQKTYTQERSSAEAANQNRSPLRVIKGSDRSFLNDTTRGATVTSKNTGANRDLGHGDTASNFNASYAKKGLQPRGLVDESGEEDTRKRYQQPEQIARDTQKNYTQRAPKQKLSPTTRRRFLKKKTSPTAAISRAKVTTANSMIVGFGFTLYTLQLFTGLLGIFAFSVLGYASKLYEETEPQTIEGILTSVATIVTNLIFDAIGYNIETYDPASLYLMTTIIIIAVGMTTLLTAAMVYRGAFIRSFTGNGSPLKIGMFTLALVGYTVGAMVPLMNIIPWFVFWTTAVWLYPR